MSPRFHRFTIWLPVPDSQLTCCNPASEPLCAVALRLQIPRSRIPTIQESIEATPFGSVGADVPTIQSKKQFRYAECSDRPDCGSPQGEISHQSSLLASNRSNDFPATSQYGGRYRALLDQASTRGPEDHRGRAGTSVSEAWGAGGRSHPRLRGAFLSAYPVYRASAKTRLVIPTTG